MILITFKKIFKLYINKLKKMKNFKTILIVTLILDIMQCIPLVLAENGRRNEKSNDK